MKVTVNSSSPYRVAINNQQPKTIRTVGIQPTTIDLANRFANLLDVDATDPDNNETVVYDSVTQKYVVKPLPVVDGGTF
jgi:hypothetical protein